ncbi:MAG: hypothetical protein ACHQRM_16400 [Bacteroidia bacterium]
MKRLSSYFHLQNPRYERLFFLLLVCAGTWPLFTARHFPFMDSPAHLYNSGIIRHLLTGDNGFINSYFTFNRVIVPNWISYLIMLPFQFFLEPAGVEKCYLLFYFLGLPLAMRYCITSISPGRGFMACLALPLVYNTLAMYSFYNFSSALIFLLLTVGYCYRNIVLGTAGWKQYSMLFLLVLLTFLSHPVVFCVALLLIFLMYVHHLYLSEGLHLLKWFNDKTRSIFIALLPSVILFLLYLRAPKTGVPVYHFLSAGDLFQGVLTGNLFGAFAREETFAAGILAMTFCAAFFISIYSLLSDSFRNLFQTNTFFLLPAVFCLLLLYRFMPDSDGMGGFISIRLSILLFLTGAVLVASVPFPKPFIVLLLGIVILSQAHRTRVYAKILKERSPEITAINDQAQFMEPESFLYSFEVDDDWLGGHYHNYMCLNRNCIPLQDYECQTGYFPVAWKDQLKMNRMVDNAGTFRNTEMLKKDLNNHTLYYWILGDLSLKKEPAYLALQHNLDEHCTLIHHTLYSSLYKLK